LTQCWNPEKNIHFINLPFHTEQLERIWHNSFYKFGMFKKILPFEVSQHTRNPDLPALPSLQIAFPKITLVQYGLRMVEGVCQSFCSRALSSCALSFCKLLFSPPESICTRPVVDQVCNYKKGVTSSIG